MAFAWAADGTRLHYQVLGRPGADPLLMIQGLGTDMSGWTLQRLAFSPRYRTIALDNRGAGRSDKPFGRYLLEEMADDAVAVLDAAGVDRAHVMGASMGGAIAQLVALRHPERVQSLILACTACSNHQWRRELLSEWAAIANERGMGEMAKRAAHWVMAPRSVRRFWPAVGWFGPLAMGLPAHAFALAGPGHPRRAGADGRGPGHRRRADARGGRQPGHPDASRRQRGAGRAHPGRRARRHLRAPHTA